MITSIHKPGYMQQMPPAQSFAPVSGYVLWLKSDTDTYQDAAFVTPAVANNDPVGGWKDQSSGLEHATQATAGKKPLLKTGILNGKPGILHDGIDDYLAGALTPLDTATGVTVFIVQQRVSRIDNSSSFSIRDAASVDYNSYNTFIAAYEPTGNATIEGYTGGSVAALTSEPANGTPYIWCMAISGAIDCYRDGTTLHYGPSTLSSPWGGATGTLYSTSRYGGATPDAPNNVYIFEILAYKTKLVAADILTTAQYLGNRYGIAVS